MLKAIQEMHVGQTIVCSHTGWHLTVIGIHTWLNSDEFEIIADFKGNDGDPWTFERLEDFYVLNEKKEDPHACT